VFHLQTEMAHVADNVFRRVDRHLVGTGHANCRIGEHTHHVFDGIFAGQRVAAFDRADLLVGIGQKQVDGRRLAFAFLLENESYARITRHVLAHDLLCAVSAPRGNHDDLTNLHGMQSLTADGVEQLTDVGFIVVGGDPDTATNGGRRRTRFRRWCCPSDGTSLCHGSNCHGLPVW
jgi:hypothetical protein